MYREAVALADCDNFFVSCERIFRPELLEKPVLVLSSNDGCVISRSEEVKRLGVGMGEPYFKIARMCEENKVSVFSSNFELYRDISQRIMSVLHSVCDTVEVYSIDEAFFTLPFTWQESSQEEVETFVSYLRARLLREISVPVSIGVAKTKTLAKVASHLSKPKNGGCGYTVLIHNEQTRQALRSISIDEVWGVGRRRTPRLRSMGVETALDLVLRDDSWVRTHMSVTGLATVRELRGVVEFPVHNDTSIRSSLMHSQSFGTTATTFRTVESAVAHHARAVAEILRKEGVCARRVGVFLIASGKQRPKHSVYLDTLLLRHTDDMLCLSHETNALLVRMYNNERNYHKAGVFVRDIVPKGSLPETTLFGEKTSARDTLMRAIDSLQERFGTVVLTGAELKGGRWEAKHEHRSPRYTTRWSEIPRVW